MPAGQAAQARGKFGAEMIVHKKQTNNGGGNEAGSSDDITENGRLKNINEYEIQKYM